MVASATAADGSRCVNRRRHESKDSFRWRVEKTFAKSRLMIRYALPFVSADDGRPGRPMFAHPLAPARSRVCRCPGYCREKDAWLGLIPRAPTIRFSMCCEADKQTDTFAWNPRAALPGCRPATGSAVSTLTTTSTTPGDCDTVSKGTIAIEGVMPRRSDAGITGFTHSTAFFFNYQLVCICSRGRPVPTPPKHPAAAKTCTPTTLNRLPVTGLQTHSHMTKPAPLARARLKQNTLCKCSWYQIKNAPPCVEGEQDRSSRASSRNLSLIPAVVKGILKRTRRSLSTRPKQGYHVCLSPTSLSHRHRHGQLRGQSRS